MKGLAASFPRTPRIGRVLFRMPITSPSSVSAVTSKQSGAPRRHSKYRDAHFRNGRHTGDALPDGSRMTAGLTDRHGIPFGTWQHRYIDWFRDLGFLQEPGIETKAAKDIESFLKQPENRGRRN